MFTRNALDDIRINRINNTESAHSVIFSTGSPQINIVPVVVVNSNLRQHSIVLNLRLTQWWAIVGNDHQLPFGVPEGFEDGFVSQGVLATLHDEGKPVVDALMSLLRLL